jgi:signal transduction histidine kinase
MNQPQRPQLRFDPASHTDAHQIGTFVPPFIIDALVAHLPLGLAVLTPDLRYLFVNERLAQINGVPVEAHIGRTVAEVVPALANQADALFRPVFTTGAPVLNLELHGETAAEPGVPRVWREHVYPLYDASHAVAAIGVVVEDVTELHAAEAAQATALMEAQQQRAVAEQAVQLRDQVLAVVAHDLKGALTIIKGQAQITQRQLKQDTVDAARMDTRLATIVQTVERIQNLTDELLDVAKLREGRPLELHRKPADLVEVVRRGVQEHQQVVATHELTFRAEVESCPASIDVPRMERVLANLLTNAVKYSPAGTEVTVTLAPAKTENSQWAVLSVIDQGIGIPQADIARVTEGFYRASNTPEHTQGTGLGLMSVHGIVAAHGGKLNITSQESQGTTVMVELPLDI